jgi:hypothetical protein
MRRARSSSLLRRATASGRAAAQAGTVPKLSGFRHGTAARLRGETFRPNERVVVTALTADRSEAGGPSGGPRAAGSAQPSAPEPPCGKAFLRPCGRGAERPATARQCLARPCVPPRNDKQSLAKRGRAGSPPARPGRTAPRRLLTSRVTPRPGSKSAGREALEPDLCVPLVRVFTILFQHAWYPARCSGRRPLGRSRPSTGVRLSSNTATAGLEPMLTGTLARRERDASVGVRSTARRRLIPRPEHRAVRAVQRGAGRTSIWAEPAGRRDGRLRCMSPNDVTQNQADTPSWYGENRLGPVRSERCRRSCTGPVLQEAPRRSRVYCRSRPGTRLKYYPASRFGRDPKPLAVRRCERPAGVCSRRRPAWPVTAMSRPGGRVRADARLALLRPVRPVPNPSVNRLAGGNAEGRCPVSPRRLERR